MLLLWSELWGGLGWAAEVEIELAHRPPAELPLFSAAEVRSVRGTHKGADCQAAVSAALSQASEGATVLRWVRSATDLQPQSQVTCRQRVAGDDVSASVVDLHALVGTHAGGGEGWPTVNADRAVQLALQLRELQGELSLERVDGRVWVRFPSQTEPELLDSRVLDANARGARLYERYVSSWAVGWVRALRAVPEVAGASLELRVTSEDTSRKKSRTTELFRFLIPTGAAWSYAQGELGDEALVDASRVERALDPKKRDFLQFLLEIDEATLSSGPVPVLAPQRQPEAGRPPLGEIDDIEDE